MAASDTGHGASKDGGMSGKRTSSVAKATKKKKR